MTTEELIAKLNVEYDRLESELPEHFLSYGRYKYWYPEVEAYHSDKYDIQRKLARQKEIRDIQSTIRIEAERN